MRIITFSVVGWIWNVTIGMGFQRTNFTCFYVPWYLIRITSSVVGWIWNVTIGPSDRYRCVIRCDDVTMSTVFWNSSSIMCLKIITYMRNYIIKIFCHKLASRKTFKRTLTVSTEIKWYTHSRKHYWSFLAQEWNLYGYCMLRWMQYMTLSCVLSITIAIDKYALRILIILLGFTR